MHLDQSESWVKEVKCSLAPCHCGKVDIEDGVRIYSHSHTGWWGIECGFCLMDTGSCVSIEEAKRVWNGKQASIARDKNMFL